ncbi:ParB family chromosome partitioning protein [Cryobacterium sp. MP_M5]|uniref:ParB/RepB/Spo0J family partition protein n=1 Tax=unclassified Cryobacterium TaxID=2649013 RepID=UPI0018CB1E3A|nr:MULTISPECIES: ParB N-terminal domain-containing protein [unclassified Cryobacterium]MBG6059802.1 ParB family chromosome partitioning protein [Cryobacterium sp. MP_M3]MEC5178119.1 ParB family chromosome partitioning protein [Cryobacterium sp. MP_M5]
MTNSIATVGTIEHIDPNLIVVEANVRTEAALGREFVASIKVNGVLTPILARRDDKGNVIVRAGQRRTLAAREAGLVTIPAYIVESDETTVERIVQQMAENDHREAVTDADRVAAFQQLAFEGLTPAVIAKRLGSKPATVKAGIAVAENAVAASAIVSHSLTLDQAATLIEFEGDDETVSVLIDIATTTPEKFAHAAQRARDEARIKAIKATATADLIERGYEILDRDRGSYETDYVSISYLSTADDEQVTVQHLTDAPGRAAYVYAYASSDTAFVRYYLKDPKAAGFRKSSGSGATSGPMTDDEKAERKTLIANNKQWASAEVVRREWLAEFLSRKTLPKDTAKAIAVGLTVHHGVVGKAIQNGNVLAHTLLGLERANYWSADKLSALVDHSPTKAQHVTLAIVLAGIEDSTSKGTWRYPDAHSALYFGQLAAWGYNLSEVEQIVIDTVAEKAATKAAEANAATVTQD